MTNGLRASTQPSVSNSALRFNYSYTVSDGDTYSVTSNLTFTASSEFAIRVDALGNPYQTLNSVTGVRMVTNLTSGATVTQSVTGLAPHFISPNLGPQSSNVFYPFSLLSSAPGLYSMDTVPYWDREGVIFTISADIPSAVQLSVRWLSPIPASRAVLTETTIEDAELVEGIEFSNPTPLLSLQRQTYSLV